MRLFVIDGNIGSGKSTILNRLKVEYPELIFIDEPLDDWLKTVDEEGMNILDLYYEGGFNFHFQINALMTLFKNLRDALLSPKGEIFVCERSIHSAFYVFSKMLFDAGLLSKIEYQIIGDLYRHYASMSPVPTTIYLEVEPEICHQRIMTRGRPEEKGIGLEYLNTLGCYYKKYIDVLKEQPGEQLKVARGYKDVVNIIIYKK